MSMFQFPNHPFLLICNLVLLLYTRLLSNIIIRYCSWFILTDYADYIFDYFICKKSKYTFNGGGRYILARVSYLPQIPMYAF